MRSRVETEAIVALYEMLGSDKDFVVTLADIYRLQGEEFLAAVAAGAGAERLAELAHRLAGSSSRLEVVQFVEDALALETNLRSGSPHTSELDAVLRALPEIMVGFETKAQALPDDADYSSSGSSL